MGMAALGGSCQTGSGQLPIPSWQRLFLDVKTLKGIPGWSCRLLSLCFFLPISLLHDSTGGSLAFGGLSEGLTETGTRSRTPRTVSLGSLSTHGPG